MNRDLQILLANAWLITSGFMKDNFSTGVCLLIGIYLLCLLGDEKKK